MGSIFMINYCYYFRQFYEDKHTEIIFSCGSKIQRPDSPSEAQNAMPTGSVFCEYVTIEKYQICWEKKIDEKHKNYSKLLQYIIMNKLLVHSLMKPSLQLTPIFVSSEFYDLTLLACFYTICLYRLLPGTYTRTKHNSCKILIHTPLQSQLQTNDTSDLYAGSKLVFGHFAYIINLHRKLKFKYQQNCNSVVESIMPSN